MEQVPSERPIFIYTLADPTEPERVRYVGQSADPPRRLRSHLCEARSGLRSHRANWLRQLLAGDRLPLLRILEEAALDTWVEREQHWIAHYRAEGARLVNQTDGGEGTLGFRWSEEERARMSVSRTGQKRPPETGKRISEALRGRRMPPAAVEQRMGRFIVTAPDGTEILILGLTPFCRQHGLHLSGVLEGRCRHSHGWRVRREGEPPDLTPIEQLKGLPYVVTTPEGIDYLATNVTRFCREHGVSRSDLQQSLNRGAAYGGWQMTRAVWLEGGWQVPAEVPRLPEFVPDYSYSPERRARMSERFRGERGSFFGKHHTEESKAKIRAAKVGRPGPNKGRKFWHDRPNPMAQRYVVTDPEGREQIVTGLTPFAKVNGLNRSMLYRVLNGKQESYKGWRIKPAPDPTD